LILSNVRFISYFFVFTEIALMPDSITESNLGWLLRASRGPMLVCDSTGMIVLANERLGTLYGWLQSAFGALVASGNAILSLRRGGFCR
jgi:PAS domain-containing protein